MFCNPAPSAGAQREEEIKMENDSDAMVWASHYLSEMAKAIIDDVTSGLQLAQGGGA